MILVEVVPGESLAVNPSHVVSAYVQEAELTAAFVLQMTHGEPFVAAFATRSEAVFRYVQFMEAMRQAQPKVAM